MYAQGGQKYDHVLSYNPTFTFLGGMLQRPWKVFEIVAFCFILCHFFVNFWVRHFSKFLHFFCYFCNLDSPTEQSIQRNFPLVMFLLVSSIQQYWSFCPQANWRLRNTPSTAAFASTPHLLRPTSWPRRYFTTKKTTWQRRNRWSRCLPHHNVTMLHWAQRTVFPTPFFLLRHWVLTLKSVTGQSTTFWRFVTITFD